MELNEGQLHALCAVQEGKNVFLTGPAGAGKSTLIQAIVTWANQERKRVDVTALTGCAALLLGQKAKTLHSWAGVGLAKGTTEALLATIQKMAYAKRRWKAAKLLIIDEISMMTPDLFEKLDTIGKAIRNKPQPWGGIQLVVCGDFFQLPPVYKTWDPSATARFVFDSPAWHSANFQPMLLSKIERQTDATFQKLLNEARLGALSEESIAVLKRRKGLPWKDLTIKPTLLFSRNADVDSINEANLAALERPLRTYEARTRVDKKDEEGVEYEDIPTGELLERLVQKMDADSSYSPRLELCEGCQVMLLYNKDVEAGLVNGSRGIVVGFRKEDSAPIVQFLHGDPVIVSEHEWKNNDVPCLKRIQIPLRVAYAVTIHKSQGATLDCALVDIGSSTFECGQAYVALSRVRNLESLYIHNLDVTRIRADPRVIEFYESLLPTETPKCVDLYEPAIVSQSSSLSSEPPFAPPGTPTSVISDCEDRYVVPCAFVAGSQRAHPSWWPLLATWGSSPAGKATLEKVAEARRTAKIFPAEADVFAALQMPLTAVKVVILGQDPYHEPGQAMGLAFSVRASTKMPPSLKNIRKELKADLGEDVWSSETGDLTPWVHQGVLLLNTVLTVEEGKAASHAKKMEWEVLTQQILKAVLEANPDVVFLAWGKFAQAAAKEAGVPASNILETTHPSPLSASKGFLGSKPFSKANAILKNKISWKLET
jgi:ATP-dependent DNA helicase PIF1